MIKPSSLEKFKVSFSFGFFQFLFPLIGIGLGELIRFGIGLAISKWIGIAVLVGVSAHMIYSGILEEHLKKHSAYFEIGGLLLLATSVSIDALSVGLSLGVFRAMAVPSSIVIGLVTFGMSLAGLEVGGRFGRKLSSGAEIAGGVILLLIAVRMIAY